MIRLLSISSATNKSSSHRKESSHCTIPKNFYQYNPSFLNGRTSARDDAFVGLGVFWEHNWTADGPVSRNTRAAWQEQIAGQIESYVTALHRDAAESLGNLIASEPEKQRFYVFNPLSWERTDAADLAYDGPEDIHVHDLAAHEDVPHQFVSVSGRRYLRILARDLPSVGYRVFEIRPGPRAATGAMAAKVSGQNDIVENSKIKLVLGNDGTIRSLVDKVHGYAELATTIDDLSINDFSPGQGAAKPIVIENTGPVSLTMRCESTSSPKHVTRITLYRDSARIDVANEIIENFGDVRHWTFSFQLESPDVHCEEVGAIIRLKKRSDGGHYAERNARYQYATLNHFCDISDGNRKRGITLSNRDCAFVRLGHSTPHHFDTTTPQLHVLAGGQVDGANLGIRGQNGAEYFLQRFALLPNNGYRPVEAMRFALGHQNPPVAGFLSGNANAPLAAHEWSMVGISDPNVLLWSLKPAEEGIAEGVIVRVWNVSDEPTSAHIRFEPKLASAHHTTHIETNLESAELRDGAIMTRLSSQELKTFRMIPDSPSSTAQGRRP
jgi:alpha-mannosidase